MAQKRKLKIEFVSVASDRATFRHRGKLMTIIAEDYGVRATRLGRPGGAAGFLFVNPAPVELDEFREVIAAGKLTPKLVEIGDRVGAIFEEAWAKSEPAAPGQLRLQLE